MVHALLDLARAHHAAHQPDRSTSLVHQAQALVARLAAQAAARPNEISAGEYYLFEADRHMLEAPDLAREYFEKALNVFRKTLGAQDVRLGRTLAGLGEIHDVTGQFADAEPLYRQALEIFRRAPDADAMHFLRTLESLASALLRLGRAAEAIPLFEEARAWPDRAALDKHSYYFLLIHSAECLSVLGRQADADRLQSEAALLLPQANPGAFGFQN